MLKLERGVSGLLILFTFFNYLPNNMADDDLMPKKNEEYSTKEYWDWRYER